MEVLVHFQFHLLIISSIFCQKRGVTTTSMIHIDLLLGKCAQCSALGFYCWSEVHLRLSVYCCTTPLVALLLVVCQCCESIFR